MIYAYSQAIYIAGAIFDGLAPNLSRGNLMLNTIYSYNFGHSISLTSN